MTTRLDVDRGVDRKQLKPIIDRPAWWTQIIVVVAFAWGYDELRSLHGDVRVAALRHGHQILAVDRWLGFSAVERLSGWVDHHDAIADALSWYYVVMHLGGAALLLLILWIDGRFYRWYRDALIAINVVGFAIFWLYPTAPPRLLGLGYGDAVAHSLPFAYHAEAAAANLYAAVPSLHAAWALWVSAALWGLSKKLWIRAIAVAHTALTTLTVIATGNHFVFDVLTGFTLTTFVLLAMRLPWLPGPSAPTAQCSSARIARRTATTPPQRSALLDR